MERTTTTNNIVPFCSAKPVEYRHTLKGCIVYKVAVNWCCLSAHRTPCIRACCPLALFSKKLRKTPERCEIEISSKQTHRRKLRVLLIVCRSDRACHGLHMTS